MDQIAEQVVEISRVLGQGLGQRGAALDIGLDGQQQGLHGGILMPARHDIERLHQGHALDHLRAVTQADPLGAVMAGLPPDIGEIGVV